MASATMAGSAEERVAEAVARIAALDPKLGAFVVVMADTALEDARHLDRQAALGVPPGPLFGMPIAVKDVIDVAGQPTGGGSLVRAGIPPALRSATVVDRLRAAGAVVVGKTATVEFAFGGWGTNDTLGTPLNPWDLTTPRTPGGSSNGSGVAVAAGLVPAALGTDTGGSIRLPASFCGVVGLKTTAGLVDKTGAMTLSGLLDTIGPLTRTVAEAARLLPVLADPARVGGADLAALAAGEIPVPKGRRIGVCADLGVTLHSCTRRLYEAALGRLEDAGAVLVPVDFGRPLAAFTERCGHYLAVEAYLSFGAFAEEEPNRLGPPVRRRILAGKALSAPEFLATQMDRARALGRIGAVFETIDALVTPTTALPAPTLAEHEEDASPAVFTRFANYLDLAAVSVPVGLSTDGLPVGLQINVPGFREPRALALAAFLEAASGGPFVPAI